MRAHTHTVIVWNILFQIQDLTILEEVLRMVLEIINSCLTHRLAHNPNLIYTLLYKKDVFQPFRMHSAFQDIVQNIDSVSLFLSDFERQAMNQYFRITSNVYYVYRNLNRRAKLFLGNKLLLL